MTKFGNVDVSLGAEDEEQLKRLAKDTAYSQLAGSYGAYAAGSAMMGAGEGMAKGGGGNPALLAAGLGIGGNMGGGMAANPSAPVGPYVPPGQGVAAGAPSAPAPAPSQAAPATEGAPGVVCAKCGHQLSAGAKFCNECGTQVAGKPVCAKCGTELAPGAKFCNECGTPTGAGG